MTINFINIKKSQLFIDFVYKSYYKEAVLAAEKKNTRAAWVGKPPMGKLPKYAGLAEW